MNSEISSRSETKCTTSNIMLASIPRKHRSTIFSFFFFFFFFFTYLKIEANEKRLI